jgi:hypothetical protein
MFRLKETDCTRRYMGRYGRAGPRIQRRRDDPPSHLSLVNVNQGVSEFDEIEKIQCNITLKERKS